jgi:hypothetical protein
MATVKIPINEGLYISDENADLGAFSPVLYNAYLDVFGNVHRRPGLEELVNTGNTLQITGLYFWEDKGIALVVDSAGSIWKIEKATNYTITNITGDTLTGNNRPTFADNGSVVVIADGGRMVSTNGSSNTAYIGDTDAPTEVTHVVFYDQYIIASVKNSDVFYWSEVNDSTDWSALSFATAESSPDPTQAMLKNYQELEFYGKRSIERWRNVGTVSPFARIPGTTIDTYGCGASYSVANVVGMRYFLDNKRRIIQVTKNIGQPIQKDLDEMSKVSDAFSDVFEIAGKIFYSITFPTDKKTYWHDIRLNKWSQMSYWYDNNYENQAHLLNSYCFAPNWGLHLVGDRRYSGKIFKMSSDIYQDDGQEIRYLHQSGKYDQGTNKRKRSSLMQFRAKRGIGAVDETMPKLMFRHREDKNWSSEKQLDMGIVGDSGSMIKLSLPGIYNTRQIELSYTESTSFVVVNVKEDVTVLSR